MLLKNHHLYIFIAICLLPAVVLYYFGDPITVFDIKDDINDGGLVDDAVTGERFNYFDLIYSKEKNSAIEIGSKAEYFAEPEPEPEPAPQPGPTGGSASTRQKEQQMVNYINEARRSAGLPTLQVSSQLTTAARAKSKDMVTNNYFDHHSPIYGGLAGLFSSFGISYRSAGENIAMNSNGNVNDANNMLMNSSGHRANILGSGYTMVGVGIYVKSDGSHYYTQLFVGN